MNKDKLVIIAGPTAVGKTDTSIELAKRINGEIISADSMQVYKYMDIGSAKISKAEMGGITHHLIDVLEPQDDFNVALFKELAKNAINEIQRKGKIPIIVGGTGFYIQSVLYDIDFTKENTNADYRKELEGLVKEKGEVYLHNMLKETDPDAAAEIHPNNTKRVMRDLEYFYLTGEKISVHNRRERAKKSPYDYCYFVLNDERENLYKSIDERVDKMLEAGLVDEVKKLKDMGLDRSFVSMQGLGYKEILSFLDEEITLDEAVYLIKRDTRHFAKRQLTWFRREGECIWIEKNKFDYDINKITDYMIERIEKSE